MNYNEFSDEIVRQVKKRVDADTKVMISSAIKNNRYRQDTLSILNKGENVSPAIGLSGYYEQYEKGVSLEVIVSQILTFYDEYRKTDTIDISCYTDFERVKDRIACKLVSYDRNRYMLSLVPHRRFLDLAVVYYCVLEDPVIGKGSILIQNTHLDMWGIDQAVLSSLAEYNTPRMLPYEFWGIDELIYRMTGTLASNDCWDPIRLYVLTNTEQLYGAVNIIFSYVLEEIYEKLGSEYYVLPSSIHECMILQTEENLSVSYLKTMVNEINSEFVEETEVLGNSIYRYNREYKRLEILDVCQIELN